MGVVGSLAAEKSDVRVTDRDDSVDAREVETG